MIHVQPQIKIHPAQGGTIPAFSRSHSQVTAPTPHVRPESPSGPILTTAFTHDQIAQRAYDIYIQNGRQEGRCQQDWKQAENELGRPYIACLSLRNRYLSEERIEMKTDPQLESELLEEFRTMTPGADDLQKCYGLVDMTSSSPSKAADLSASGTAAAG